MSGTFLLSSSLAILAAGMASQLPRERPQSIQIEPETVRIGLFYSGQNIRIRADVPHCDGIALRLTGPERSIVLKRKGKKFGLVWMNVGQVHYERVPSLYLLRSSQPLEQIGPPDQLKELGLGFPALRTQVTAGMEGEAAESFGELVKLKWRDGLYATEVGGISFRPLRSGRQEATAEIFLPPKTPAGQYTVDVFAFVNGKGKPVGTGTVCLDRTRVVAFITGLATRHGLLYGCLAVAVAITAGLATGLLFGMGKGRAH
ncbi:MAG TPA: hypothetical protein EYP56_02510 [Planctomycetaceae bacterium]|nr:hypothetical protein [Planctomycetaceae bacterium]